MLDLSTCIKFYKREDVQQQMVASAKDRELGTRYLKGFFGKRPDVLVNEGDVLEFAKQGVSSFHISEEHWQNPMHISSDLKKRELDKIRIGWDLIVDIDCPSWELSKRIAFAVIKIFKNHGIKSISCKFSGNKGFHVGVPFKAFPKQISGKDATSLFPDGAKRILSYIIHIASKDYSDEILSGMDIKSIASSMGITESELIETKCSSCGSNMEGYKKTYSYVCSKCGKEIIKEEPDDFISCSKCKSIVKISQSFYPKCRDCGASSKPVEKLNLGLIFGLDEILISSRHLYRMPYSLHEKSGLCSLPINPFRVLSFDKSDAKPENVSCDLMFLDDSKTVEGEASDLVLRAFDYKPDVKYEKNEFNYKYNGSATGIEGVNQEKIPIELFPPSILKMLEGLKDGRKRALFVLTNFLVLVGWDYPEIEELLFTWNEKNFEPLREREIKSHLTYHKSQKKKVPPPNYSNKMYYSDLGVLSEQELNSRSKNPVVYAKRMAYQANKGKKRKKKEGNSKKQGGDNKVKGDNKEEQEQEKKGDQKGKLDQKGK